MTCLEELRGKIDEIDRKLGELFEQRMELVEKIAEYKRQNGLPVLDREREKAVIEKNISRLKKKKLVEETEDFFSNLMRISREYQEKKIAEISLPLADLRLGDEVNSISQKIRVCFQGTTGSFSEQALDEYFGNGVEKLAVSEFEDVFKELENKQADYGVLPLENSSTGGVAEVYDLLRQYGFYIVGEKCIDVEQHLLGLKGAKLSLLREVYSHPQALEQSRKFLKDHPNLILIPYYNTAASAEYVKQQGDIHKAAIASRRAAEAFGLEIIQENINHNRNNKTRFVIIGRELKIAPENDKISVVFALEHRAGSLYNALKYFAENKLNLLKIESRPILERPWQYFFYLDFEGNIQDPKVQEAIKLVKENSYYFKLLGNYEKSL
ncbi:MAG TPA: prephenate dehydratase [Clostridia bacterium]|nr:prephenate dehydratase [Clostridia bacterium]